MNFPLCTFLAQISEAPSVPIEGAKHSISLFDIIEKGGIIMIPIALLSMIAVYIFVERLIAIRKSDDGNHEYLQSLILLLKDGKKKEAVALCNAKDKPLSRMLCKGIKQIDGSRKEMEEVMEEEGKFEVYELEKGISILAVIAGIAPMLGFLGTILGVIKIFFDISQTSDVSIGVISSGLYVKMVSSAAGLTIGIMAYLFYHWLNLKVSRLVNGWEKSAMRFMDEIRDRAL